MTVQYMWKWNKNVYIKTDLTWVFFLSVIYTNEQHSQLALPEHVAWFFFFVFLWVHFIQGPESHVTQILHRSGADALFPVGDGRMDNVFTLIASVESN